MAGDPSSPRTRSLTRGGGRKRRVTRPGGRARARARGLRRHSSWYGLTAGAETRRTRHYPPHVLPALVRDCRSRYFQGGGDVRSPTGRVSEPVGEGCHRRLEPSDAGGRGDARTTSRAVRPRTRHRTANRAPGASPERGRVARLQFEALTAVQGQPG